MSSHNELREVILSIQQMNTCSTFRVEKVTEKARKNMQVSFSCIFRLYRFNIISAQIISISNYFTLLAQYQSSQK